MLPFMHPTGCTVFPCLTVDFLAENPNVLSNPLHAIDEAQDVTATENSSDDGRENEEEFKALMKQTMHSDEWQEIKDENYGEFYFFNARLKVCTYIIVTCSTSWQRHASLASNASPFA